MSMRREHRYNYEVVLYNERLDYYRTVTIEATDDFHAKKIIHNNFERFDEKIKRVKSVTPQMNEGMKLYKKYFG